MNSSSQLGPLPGALRLLTCVLMAAAFMERSNAVESRISPAPQVLPGHLPAKLAGLQPSGRLDGTTRLNLAVGLPLRNREVLTNLLDQLCTPGSPRYHQWLSTAEFTEQFGPAREDYEEVTAFLQAQGLTVTATYANRMLVSVAGFAEDIEKAFNIKLMVYPHPEEDRTFYAPDVEPSLALSVPVLHISGLDNYQLPRPASLRVSPLPQPQDGPKPQSGSGTGGTYFGPDFRVAYAQGVTLTGAGQYVGLLQFDGYYMSDILSYASQAGITNVPLQNVLLDLVTGIPGGAGNNIEVALDIEMALSMAPGLAGIIVYEGASGNSILNRMAVDNLAKQLSASWTYGTDATSAQIFQEYVAQGQNYFNASGDSGAYPGQPSSPTDSPYITSVGGTTLTTRGPAQAWMSEKTWSWFNAGTGNGASSGGISATWPIPVWQQGLNMSGNQGSTAMRNIPDVAMVSDNVLVFYNNGQQGTVGGDSIASPLWAAFLALVNQQAAANNQPPVGFINPAIYTIGKSTSFLTDFHDIKTGNNTNASNPSRFFAVNGYDLCTGWGTPIGKPLINALAPPANGRNVIGAGAVVTLETCTPLNGTLNPGEPVIVSFSLQNIGLTNTASLVATLQSNIDVTPLSGPQNYGALIGGGAAVSRSFVFIPNGPCGGTVNATLQLQDGTNSLNNVFFSFAMGSPVLALSQNFDAATPPALPGGWGRQNTGGGVSNWVTTTSFRYTTPNSASITGTTNLGISDLLSPTIPITTASAQLSFRNSYVTEIDPTNMANAFDGGILEIKIGGGSFADILSAGGSFVTNGYTRTLDLTTGNPLGGRQAWAGTSGGFITSVINLPAAAAGQSIQLKWRLAADTGNAAGSTFWYIDDVTVRDGTTCCIPDTNADMSVFQSVSPNPGLVGSGVAYSIAITNFGPGAATSVTFTDALPPTVSFNFASPGCIFTNGMVTAAFPLLTNGGRTNFTIVITPVAEGSLTNTLTTASALFDPNASNNVSMSVIPVYAAPTVSVQPSNAIVLSGASVSFSAIATGTAPLSYQWLLAGTNLDGATNSILQLTNVQAANTGDYQAVVTNSYGSATSSVVHLALLTSPPIQISSPGVGGSNTAISVSSVTGLTYRLEYKDALDDPIWIFIDPPVPGNGGPITLVDTNTPPPPARFYRVSVY